MLNNYLGELLKFYKHRLFTIFSSIVLLVFVIGFWIQYSVVTGKGMAPFYMTKNITFPYVLIYSIDYSSVFLMIISYIIICCMIGNEYGWNTFKTIAMRGTGKLQFLNSKILAVLTITVFYVICGVVLLSVLALFFQSKIMDSAAPNSGSSNINPIFVFVVLIIFILWLLPYIGLGLFVTVLTKSAGAGIGIGFAYFIIGEPFLTYACSAISPSLGDWLNEVPNYFLGSQIRAISSVNLFELDSEKEYLLQIYQPLLISIDYAFSLYFASMLLIKRRDILN